MSVRAAARAICGRGGGVDDDRQAGLGQALRRICKRAMDDIFLCLHGGAVADEKSARTGTIQYARLHPCAARASVTRLARVVFRCRAGR